MTAFGFSRADIDSSRVAKVFRYSTISSKISIRDGEGIVSKDAIYRIRFPSVCRPTTTGSIPYMILRIFESFGCGYVGHS